MAYNRMYFFCLQVDVPITWARGGEAYFAAFDGISTNYLNVAGSLHASAADVQSLWKMVKIYPAKLSCILSI